jgi:hypothetical protein
MILFVLLQLLFALKHDGQKRRKELSFNTTCENTYQLEWSHFSSFYCVKVELIQNHPSVIGSRFANFTIECENNLSVYSHSDEISVGFFRQFFGYLGFSADEDPESFMNVVTKTDSRLDRNYRITNLFSERDLQDISKVYKPCQEIVRRKFKEKTLWETDGFMIVTLSCVGFIFLCLFIFVATRVYRILTGRVGIFVFSKRAEVIDATTQT